MTKIRHNDERTDNNCDVQSRVREGSPVRVTPSQRQFTAGTLNKCCSEEHLIDGWQHKDAMSTFWRNWDSDTVW